MLSIGPHEHKILKNLSVLDFSLKFYKRHIPQTIAIVIDKKKNNNKEHDHLSFKQQCIANAAKTNVLPGLIMSKVLVFL